MGKILWPIMIMTMTLKSQAAESWICQGINTIGFNWNTEEGYRWEEARISVTELVLTIDDAESYFTFNSQVIPVECEEYSYELGESFVSCVRSEGLAHDFLVLNLISGQAALSQLGGSITSNTFYRESVATYIFQCRKS